MVFLEEVVSAENKNSASFAVAFTLTETATRLLKKSIMISLYGNLSLQNSDSDRISFPIVFSDRFAR